MDNNNNFSYTWFKIHFWGVFNQFWFAMVLGVFLKLSLLQFVFNFLLWHFWPLLIWLQFIPFSVKKREKNVFLPSYWHIPIGIFDHSKPKTHDHSHVGGTQPPTNSRHFLKSDQLQTEFQYHSAVSHAVNYN